MSTSIIVPGQSIIPADRASQLPQPIVPAWFTPSLLRGMRQQQMLNQPAFPSAVFDQIMESRYPALTAAAVRYAAFGPSPRCPVYEGRFASVPADIAELMAIMETTHQDRAIAAVAGWVPCSDNRLYNLDMAQVQAMMTVSALRTRARCMKALSKRHERAALPPAERINVGNEAEACRIRSVELAETLEGIKAVREAMGVSWTTVDVRRPSGPWVRRQEGDMDTRTAEPAPSPRQADTQTMDMFQDLFLTSGVTGGAEDV